MNGPRNRTDHRKETVMPRMLHAAALVAVLTILAVLAGCQAPAAEGEATPERPRNVRVLRVERTELAEYLEITGPVEPVRGANVSAEEGGRVVRVPHDKGDRVAAGDALMMLDRRLLAAEVAAASAAAAQQEHNAEKTRELFAAGRVSEQEKLDVDAMAAQARAVFEAATIRHERAAVAAPFAGLVVDRYVEPGELVAPGMVVARVIDPYVLKITGTVSEREVVWVQDGAEALVLLDGHDEPVAGRVHWIGFEAERASGKFAVEIRVDNADLALRSGVVARARIHRRTHADVVTVPRDAVLNTAEGEAVFVVEGDRAALRLVELGVDQGLMVIVTDGLAAGDELVVRGHRDLVAGSLVEITERSERRDGGLERDPVEVGEGSAAPREAGEAAE